MSAILAIDTATNACSAAFRADGEVRAHRYELMERGHAERLMPMIAEVMTEAGKPVKAVDLIAVTVGPGAFTGLRVGLAAARGLALAAAVPCFGVTTTEAIAAAVEGDRDGLVVVMDSKRADFYVQVFEGAGRAISEPAAVLPDALAGHVAGFTASDARLVVAGNAADRAVPMLGAAGISCTSAGIDYPDAAVLAGLAGQRWTQGQDVPRPAPVYLRPPDAVVPVNGGRLRP